MSAIWIARELPRQDQLSPVRGYALGIQMRTASTLSRPLRHLASEEVGSETNLIEDDVKEQRAWLRKMERRTWNSIVELYFPLSNLR